MTGGITQEKERHSHIRLDMCESYIGFNTFYYTDPRRISSKFEASNDIERYKFHLDDVNEPAVLGYDEYGFQPITLDTFRINIRKSKGFLIKLIMDQRSIVSGIGNYLLSEIMYEAGLDPDVKVSDLNDEDITRLFNSINIIINKSYNAGGVSMKDYKHIDGTHGSFQELLKVYNKSGSIIDSKEILTKKGKHGRNIWYVSNL